MAKKNTDPTRLRRGRTTIKIDVDPDEHLAAGIEQELRAIMADPKDPRDLAARDVLDEVVQDAAKSALEVYRQKGRRARYEEALAETERLKRELGAEEVGPGALVAGGGLVGEGDLLAAWKNPEEP